MSVPKLLVTRKLPDPVQARLAEKFDCKFNDLDEPYTQAEILEFASDVAAIACIPGDPFNAGLVGQLPAALKIISTFSVGFEHIDLDAAKAAGIMVTHTPDVLNDATADVAMLLMLGAARRAAEGMAMIREDRWHGLSPTDMLGTHLGGLRLGIYGMGRIGQVLAHRARAFGMEIHYHNRRQLPAAEEAGSIFHDTLDSLLGVSDVLSIHAPLTPQTRKFLDAGKIALLPDGAIVVNTARGGVVDDDALIAATRSGKLSAIGLDVFDGEPKIHPDYRTLPNAFLLPHLGSATVQTRNAMGFCVCDNLEAWKDGRDLPNRLV